jgi:hypothetical protein
MIWVDWHLGQFIDLTEIFQGSDLKFTITMHYYRKSEYVGQVLAHRCAYLNGLIGNQVKPA